MSSIVETLLKESSVKNSDILSIRETSMRFLFEADDEKKVDTAMQKSAKAMKALADKLEKMPKTRDLVKKAADNLTKSLASGEKDEETAALFSLSNQFGASLLPLLNNINSAIETVETPEIKLVNNLGGPDELKKTIEKTFKPSSAAIAMIQKANELVAKAKDITAKGEASEADEAKGRGETEDVFEIEDVKDVDEGIFSNIGNFIKGLFKGIPKTTAGTVRSLMPLFGGGNVAKTLVEDLTKIQTKDFTEMLQAISPSLNELSPGNSEKVDAPAAPAEGGGNPEATPTAGASVAAENPDLAKQIAAAVEKALGDRAAAAAGAVRDIGSGTDPKKATSGLSDDDKAILKALLSKLGGEGGDAEPSEIVAAVKDTAGGGGGGNLKYGKYLDADRIKKVAGDKGPAAVDSLLDKEPTLRRELGIKDSRARVGRVMRESMYSFLFEEVAGDVVKAFKDGLKDSLGKELSDDEAKEIAQSIVDKTSGGGKEGKGEGDEGEGESLSSLLFTRVDNNDISKGYKAKKDKPGSKSSSIKMHLANLTTTMAGIDPKGNLDKPENINKVDRGQLMRHLGKLQDDLKGVKIESKSSENEVILERWQRLAGLKD